MAKIAKTTAKYSETHDRLTVTCTFASGEKVRVNSSRYRDSMSGTVDMRSPDTKKFFSWATKCIADETQGDRMKRVKAHIEKFDTFAAAVAAI